MKAKAKINLFLHVLGKQPNGYHQLESMVTFAEDICDKIFLKPSSTSGCEFLGEFGQSLANDPAENIVLKAAKLLLKFDPHKLALIIEKNIPVAAGLGGGSSDAATAIKLLQELFNINLDQQKIIDLCLEIGADVPVCYFGKACYFAGVGEKITLINKFPKCYAVVVNPLMPLVTKEVFSHITAQAYGKSLVVLPNEFDCLENLIVFLAATSNQMEQAAIGICPEIAKILNELELIPDCLIARMSGSGPTCFALFSDQKAAVNAAILLNAKHPNWWVKPTLLS